MNRVGNNIKTLRKELHMTQEQLGNYLGVQKSAVQKYESGKIKNLKQDTIIKLSSLFGVHPSTFVPYSEIYDEKELSRQCIVFDEIKMNFGEEVVDLVGEFLELNDEGKKRVIEHLEDMSKIYAKG